MTASSRHREPFDPPPADAMNPGGRLPAPASATAALPGQSRPATSSSSHTVPPEAIDALLPQTQCTRCGYQGCKPYSEAIAAGEAPINQCPPGGAATIDALARLTGQPPLPLNPANGIEGPELVARIDEERCIGCAKCLPPCPVDAIVGMRKQMHTVVAEVCTGCELCVAPCPVDCITMIPRESLVLHYAAPAPAENRARYEARNSRIARRAQSAAALLAERKQAARAGAP